jgi:hypothetical protein
MAVVFLGFLLYPEWTLSWTRRLEFRYYYDADLPRGASTEPPPEIWQTGCELQPLYAVQRHWIFFAPRPPREPLPSPTSELTGTGSVNLGKRHTVYTGITLLDRSATLNLHKTAFEIVVMPLPFAMFLFLFRSKTRRLILTKPPSGPPEFIRRASTQPTPPDKADTPPPRSP